VNTTLLESKNEKLKEIFKELKSVVVAFSGGVDSTFMLAKAVEVLGKDKVLAVTATSPTYPLSEFKESKELAKQIDVEQLVIDSNELEIEGYKDNPIDRCFFCKSELFTLMQKVAKEKGYDNVVEGATVDDLGDYRPGLRAVKELGVKSPILEAEMTKDDVRALSKEMKLPTWDKPAKACLASRFPYGEEITAEKLEQVEKAEDYLYSLGFKMVRVRHHGDVCRIELNTDDIYRFTTHQKRRNIIEKLRECGFKYITFDLEGYRTGSMNETLDEETLNKEKRK
jgi:uncharacterized protein